MSNNIFVQLNVNNKISSDVCQCAIKLGSGCESVCWYSNDISDMQSKKYRLTSTGITAGEGMCWSKSFL